MTNNTADSSFALVPEEAARQEIENLRKENSELKAVIEAYKQLPATLEEKLREKESELARSEADLRRARQEKHELRCRLADAAALYLRLFTRLVEEAIETDDEQGDRLENNINSLHYPADVIEAMINRDGLRRFKAAIDPVIADDEERLELFLTMLHAADDAAAVAREPDLDD